MLNVSALALFLCTVKLELGPEPVVMGMQMNSFIEIFKNEGGLIVLQAENDARWADWFDSEDWL